jgi:hypothetical protein
LQAQLDLPVWVTRVPPALGAVGLISALLLLLPNKPLPVATRAVQISAVFIVFISLARALVYGAAGPSYDTHEISRFLHDSEQRGVPVAHVGQYQGQYHFSGRLTRPLTIVDAGRIATWLEENPNGLVITYHDERPGDATQPPAFAAPYRSKWVAIRPAAPASTTAGRFTPASDSGRKISLSDMTGEP